MARRGRYGPPDGARPRSLLWSLQRLGDATTTCGRCSRGYSTLGVVLADAEFDSEHNHRHVHEQLVAATSVIPAKRGKATWRVEGYRAKMRAAFPRQLYTRRALVESVFSAVKRKLSARAPGCSLEMQRTQALLLGLAYNLYRLSPAQLKAYRASLI